MDWRSKMRVTLLGSGTGIPLASHGSPSILLSTERAQYLLDLGPGTLRRLAHLGISHERISGVFVTHFHPDHSLDLVHLLFATRHPPVLRQRRPFFIAGPIGLNQFLLALHSAYGDWISLPKGLVKVVEVHPGADITELCPPLTIKAAPTGHTSHSLAYRFDHPQSGSIVYTGDTVYSEEVIGLARGADLLITECSFPDELPVDGHLTPSIAAKMATEAGVKKLALCHFYPEALASKIASQCRGHFQGELVLSSDGLEIAP